VPNKIKTNPETPIVFQPSNNPFPSGPGMPSGVIVDFRPASTASNAGRISAEYDLGQGPRTTLFEWRGNATIGSGATVGTSVDAYISTSNSVFKDGHMPTTEGAIASTDKRRNLQFCGSMVVDSATDPANAAGVVEIFGRYISVLWWNNTNVPLGTGNCFILTPVPDEIQ
jgi:hypothetical protein